MECEKDKIKLADMEKLSQEHQETIAYNNMKIEILTKS